MVRTLVILAIIAAIAGGVLVALRWSGGRVDDEQRSVIIRASYTKTECTVASPVKIMVENHSDNTLKALSFDLDVYLDGDSTNLSGADAPQTWTTIVAPHSSATACFALPHEARDRIAHASGRRAYTVRAEGHVASFYAEGEFIPTEAPSSEPKPDASAKPARHR